MAGTYIDLHSHSTESDGSLTPEALTRYAAEKGLVAYSLTDHDTVAGLDRAMKTGREVGVEIVPGIEISAVYQEKSLHMLGYFIDPASESLQSGLDDLIDARNQRNPKIIAKLQALGIEITLEEVERESEGKVIGRPHFAACLIRHGVVKDFQSAFEKYLGDDGLVYVPKDRLPPADAIALIRDAGGLAVFAHPPYLGLTPQDEVTLITELCDAGLDGIESIYGSYDNATSHRYAELASRFGLLQTGGSDYHGAKKAGTDLGVGRGNLRVPVALLDRMKEALRNRGH